MTVPALWMPPPPKVLDSSPRTTRLPWPGPRWLEGNCCRGKTQRSRRDFKVLSAQEVNEAKMKELAGKILPSAFGCG